MFTIRGSLYLVLAAAVTSATADSASLPTVDLGYAIHQATINVGFDSSKVRILSFLISSS